MGILQGIKDIFSGPTDQQVQDSPPVQGNSFTPFPDRESEVDFVEKEFDRRQKERRDYELQWMLNINFVNSNQYCDINLSAKTIYQQTPAYDWQEMEVFNQIAPIYEARLSKLCKNKPIPFVRPASNETRDMSAAKTSKAILRGLDSNLDMSSKRALMTSWSDLTGCAFLKRRWDVSSGNYIGQDENGQVYDGDIEKDVVNSFEIFPDSNFANGIEGCKSIIHARSMLVEDIAEKWGVELKGRKVDVFTLSQSNIGGGLGYFTTNHKFTVTTIDNSEIVKEMMLLPCKRFPQGLNIITAAKQLLYSGPFIYRVGKNGAYGFPLEMQCCILNPGFFWPTSIIERLIPIQRAYNAVKNRKHEILNRKAIGNLAVEDDGNVDTEELEREGLYPGKIHIYQRGTHAPTFLENKDSTTDFSEEEKSLREEFTMISGVSPFSAQSLPPSGVVSGDAMEQLREADDSRISLTRDNINAAAIQGWKIDLRLYRQFVPESSPRLLRCVGDNNDIDLVEWYASDLTSDDVIIDNEDELMLTPAQQRSIAIEFLQYGLYDENKVPAKTRREFLKTYKFGNPENIDDEEEMHSNKARRENKLIVKEQLPVFKDYDMHEIHIQDHNRFRLDVAYENFEREQPQLAAAFDAHVKQHEQMIMQKAAMIAQQMNPQEEQKPAQSIPFKDLPVSGKLQQAKQAGIELTVEDLVQQIKIDQQAKQKQNEPKEKAS